MQPSDNSPNFQSSTDSTPGMSTPAAPMGAAAPVPLPYLSHAASAFRRLSLHGAAFLACRILALWLATQVLQSLSYVVVYLVTWLATSSGPARYGSQAVMRWGPWLPPIIVPLVLACVLWWKADWLAGRMVRSHGGDGEAGDWQHATPGAGAGPVHPFDETAPLLAIALMSAGAFVLAEAMPELARRVMELGAGSKEADANSQTSFWVVVIKMAIGLWLLFGSGGLARLVFKLRRRDTGPAATDQTGGADGPL